MAGLINTTLQDPVKPIPMADPTKQPQYPTGASGYNPTQVAAPTPWTVDDKQTVAGQVKQIIDENGPLQQQAATRADQQMNRRGLMNSSMAVGAGQSAVMDAALPIAQADASTYGKAAGYNTDQINQGNVLNAQFSNAAGQFNAGAQNTRSNQDAAAQAQKELQTMQSGTQVQLQGMQSQSQENLQKLSNMNQLQLQQMVIAGQLSQTDLQNVNKLQLQQMASDTQINISKMDQVNKMAIQDLVNKNQQLIQTNSQAASLMNQATGVINNIMMNDKMDGNAKTEASRQVYDNLKIQMDILGKTSGLDLSSLLIENPYAVDSRAADYAAAQTAKSSTSPFYGGGSGPAIA